LRYGRLDVLEDREQQRGAAGMPDEHGLLVEAMFRQYLRQERPDRLDVDSGVMRDLDGVPAFGQSAAQPRVPAVAGVPAGTVENDRLARHGGPFRGEG
jgi:hypothetical protein